MKVKAIRTGYHGNFRRYEGVEFYVKKAEFSKEWMVEVDEKAKPEVKEKPEAKSK